MSFVRLQDDDDSSMGPTTSPSALLVKSNPNVVYRDNGNAIYSFTVDVTSSEKNEQLIAVATALCPDLLLLEASSSYLSNNKRVHDDENEEPSSCDDSSASSFSTVDEAAAEPFGEEDAPKQRQQPLLSVRPLLGGLSNELFVVENEATGVSVLVRIHPDTTAGASAAREKKKDIVDRDVENKLAAWLSSLKGEAPVFYGRFRNGRVEQFFPSVEPLTPALMHTHAARIGCLLGRLHTLQVPSSIFPLPSDSDKRLQLQGAIWKRVEDWFGMMTSSSELLGELQTEWRWLREAFQRHYEKTEADEDATQARQFLREVVLTHMDCQSLNLLKACSSSTSSNEQLRLIDYEYAGLNPRAADIANTFCEFCSMNAIAADFSAEYPSAATQNDFLRAYCQTAGTAARRPDELSSKPPSDSWLAALRNEIGRYTVLSHLQWAVWSLVQQQNRGHGASGPITCCAAGFDYGAYARHRVQGYRHHKRLFWGTD